MPPGDHRRFPVRARGMADQIPVPVAAEAITDRLSSQAYKIIIKGGKSMRETIHA